MPWLDPDINDVIDDLAAAGRRGVIVVPIGFVSDHVEVVWDLDNEAAETAAERGLVLRPGAAPRASIRGSSPTLADLIAERLGTAACRTGDRCCPARSAGRISVPPGAA